MKESIYKNYDELPLFLNAATVSKVLGIAPSSSYELMHEKCIPSIAYAIEIRCLRHFQQLAVTVPVRDAQLCGCV